MGKQRCRTKAAGAGWDRPGGDLQRRATGVSTGKAEQGDMVEGLGHGCLRACVCVCVCVCVCEMLVMTEQDSNTTIEILRKLMIIGHAEKRKSWGQGDQFREKFRGNNDQDISKHGKAG